MMNTLPLLPNFPSDAILARRKTGPISREEFLREVLALAAHLPDTGHVLNLCKDRYKFTVALFAAISRGMLSLLPNSNAAEHIASLCAGVPDVVCLGDQASPPLDRLPYVLVSDADPYPLGVTPDMPRIPFDQPVACVFTSGSTGQPQPHRKTFGRLHLSAWAEAERIWAATGGPCTVLGTVPFSHMYGLESSVLLPILGGGQMSASVPFFPADVVTALKELPLPRLLVTTPFHLRKLLEADIEIPGIAAILSATAPLPLELARQAEARLGAPMLEIYGSTETGQLAMRRPTSQDEWQTYPGITLSQDRGTTIAAGGHIECPQVLNDTMELISPSSFRLVDRNSNLINIAGKRSSLAFLNHVIASLPGVRDGTFCMPHCGEGEDVARLAAFVVAPGQSMADILAALRPHIDPVFLPRPIVALDALPRDGNGKIPASAMAALIAEHVTRKN